MLKINLLPPYIYEGATRRKVTLLWVAILIVVVGLSVWAKVQLDSQAKDIKDKTEAARPDADKADKTESEAVAIETASATIRGKADFVKQARTHDGEVYPGLFSNIATYTHKGTLYDSVNPQGNTVTISAYARSLWDVGLYMIWMENNPKISNVAIAMNSIPSFPLQPGMQQAAGGQGAGVRPPGGGGHDFTATLTLLQPVPTGPSYPPGSAPAAGGGFGGPAGMGRGGMGGPPMMGPMGPGGPMGGSMMGSGGGMGGMSRGGPPAGMSGGPVGSGGGMGRGGRKGGAED